MEPEIWSPVTGWDVKYWISNHGRFKSFGRRFKNKYTEGYITYGYSDTVGYKSATLRRIGYKEDKRIHVLVAEHFCTKVKGNECVNHLDGDKFNNYYKNLEWDTFDGNSKHAVSSGLLDMKGEKHHFAKVTRESVIRMRMLRKKGLTHKTIGEIFGVCRRQAGDIINGVNWGWLKEGL